MIALSSLCMSLTLAAYAFGLKLWYMYREKFLLLQNFMELLVSPSCPVDRDRHTCRSVCLHVRVYACAMTSCTISLPIKILWFLFSRQPTYVPKM